MNIISRYPWPVLGDSDAVSGIFSPIVEVNLGPENIIIRGNFNLENKTIIELIGGGNAKYVMQITCIATHFRRCHLFLDSQFEVSIPAVDLRGVVSLEYFVVAARDIANYINSTAHPDYENASVNLAPGDILADGGSEKFDAKKRYAGTKNISDFLEVVRDPHLSGQMIVSSNQEKIIVRLASLDYDKLAVFANSKAEKLNSLLQSGIAFPAILIAMQYAFEEPDYHQQFMWFNVLKERAEKANIEWSKENISSIAQAILRRPVERMLSGLKELADEPEE
jgi:hypothetical protein